MLELWLVLILLVVFFAAAIGFWANTYIIDIVKAVEVSRKNNFTRMQWFLIWTVSILFVLVLLFLSYKFKIEI